MEDDNLTDLVQELLSIARTASSGRAARTIQGDHEHALRQTVIALRAGERMGEHESPGEATLQVLTGRVRVNAGGVVWEGLPGDHTSVPAQRQSVDVLEDSAVLLTVVKTAHAPSS
jgi:quercetin dioxygenase-like cupin family protein